MNALGRVIPRYESIWVSYPLQQERDARDTVTARYYWLSEAKSQRSLSGDKANRRKKVTEALSGRQIRAKWDKMRRIS
ncbi:MAG: hypothetical protein V2G43_06940 [bacterium JZ-2024 1]